MKDQLNGADVRIAVRCFSDEGEIELKSDGFIEAVYAFAQLIQ